MKDIVHIIFRMLPTTILSVGAVILALNGIGEWFWFLVIALLMIPNKTTVK